MADERTAACTCPDFTGPVDTRHVCPVHGPLYSDDQDAARSDLDYLRANGLCAICREPLTEKEKALEGVGGSYVRCDECVQEIQRNGPEFAGGPVA